MVGVVNVFKMAASRSRRANAGSRISQLVEQDLNKDEFYQTAYGGFEEVAVDEEYEVSLCVYVCVCVCVCSCHKSLYCVLSLYTDRGFRR